MTRPTPDRPSRVLLPLQAHLPFLTVVLTLIAVVAILHFAEEVFMPLALAALLSFMLTPVAQWLERHHVNRVVAVLVTTATAFALLAGLVYVVGNQFLGLVKDLPAYKDNLVAKMQPLRTPLGGSLDETAGTLRELTEELDPRKDRKPPAPRVTKVEVVDPPPSPLQVVANLFGPIMKPLGTAAVVLLFVIFMLLEREMLRDRLIRVTGARDLQRTTQALDEATRRISRYLAMQTLVNSIQGTLVAIGLYFIGVPNAVLWGALTIALRFIPYVGPWVAALMPIALSFAAFHGWHEPILAAALIITLELISNNVLEPWLYGHETGVSPLALLVAALFWTWLWGVPGLFLAIPLTVSLVVMGKYIPQLRYFSVLFGDEQVLEPHERFYQRLLAREPEDAEEILTEVSAQMNPIEQFDQVILPALGLAQQDFNRGSLDETLRRYIFAHVDEAAEELCERTDAGGADTVRRRPPSGPLVLCVAANGEADELAARMFARLLHMTGVAARALPLSAFKGEYIEAIGRMQPACVCIAAFPPAAVTHASYVCKMVRSRFDDLPLVVGLWGAPRSTQGANEKLRAAGAEDVVDSFNAALVEIGRLLQPAHHLPAAAQH
jgi:predicted PurR-regulated permease PerM